MVVATATDVGVLDRRGLCYAETDAPVHDSQKLDEVLDKSNTSNEVWADSAYRSVESEAKLKARGYKSRIHRRGARNHPLSDRQQAANTTRSRVRARVEHIFGDQQNAMGASSCAPSAWRAPARRSG